MDSCVERRTSPAVRTALVLVAAVTLLYFLLPSDAYRRDDRLHYLSHPDFHLAPKSPLTRENWAVVEPSAESQEPEVTVILLHGLGDAPTELPFVDGLSDSFPFVRW